MVASAGWKGRKAKEGEAFVERTYRDFTSKQRWVAFSAAHKETDLYVRAEEDLSEQTRQAILLARKEIEDYIRRVPAFQGSLTPLPLDPAAPPIVQEMLRAGRETGVGPMAAVAGAIAEYVGRFLLRETGSVIVENGGDIFLAVRKEATVGIFAGGSSLSMRMGIRIRPDDTPCGICTSSGKVGPSLSFGKADAVTVLATSTALADAAATALANQVRVSRDIEPALECAGRIRGLRGAVVILEDRIGLWGAVELVRVNP